jgi:hypothetical protein
MLISSLDWETCLKPRIIPTIVNVDALFRPQGEAQGSCEPPNKIKQAEQLYPSPESSENAVTKNKVGSSICNRV